MVTYTPEVKYQRARAKLDALTPDERAAHNAKRREQRRVNRERRIAAYMAENGSVPLCGCGCGGSVDFDADGSLRTYLVGHNPKRPNVKSGERIPVEKVQTALRNYKAKSGETWVVIAEKAGMSLAHLNDILYDRSKWKTTGIERTLVEDMLRRLMGYSAPPSSYMLAQEAKLRKRQVVLCDGSVVRAFEQSKNTQDAANSRARRGMTPRMLETS